MLRVLIVVPRFPPTNAADAHRMRLLLPYLAEHGCQVDVLAVDPHDIAMPLDPWLVERLPRRIPIHRVRALALRGWGLNGLAQRTLLTLYLRGSQLLANGHFDLVFFSTTEFLVHLLGPLWQQRFGVPFCIDYQDPWVNDYYRDHPEVTPPGGRLKFGLMDRLHRIAEWFVVPRCAGFLAVSEAYFTMLDQRYATAVAHQPRLVQPFPGEPAEFAAPSTLPESRTRSTSARVIRYIGRGGPDMQPAAQAFFAAWRTLLDSGTLDALQLRFEAIGTSYAADGKGKQTFLTIATTYGLTDVVGEQPDRISYQAMLNMLQASDALIVFGSNDPGYTASKLYPYLLARRPLLAIMHRASPVVQVIREVGGAVCITFDTENGEIPDLVAIQQFLLTVVNGVPPQPLHMQAFAPYTAQVQAQHLVNWFHQILAAHTNCPVATNV